MTNNRFIFNAVLTTQVAPALETLLKQREQGEAKF
jgi:hypothetical protein